MNKKITNVELAKIFGYEKVTFTRWKNTATLELLARLEWLKLGGIMIKNNIAPYQVLAQQETIEKLKLELETIKSNLKKVVQK